MSDIFDFDPDSISIPENIIDIWADALESDLYTKGGGRLKNVRPTCTSYCCLGVLADKLDPNGWGDPNTIGTMLWHGHNALLPERIWRRIPINLEMSHLVNVNDGVPRMTSSFKDIAAIIRRNRTDKPVEVKG